MKKEEIQKAFEGRWRIKGNMGQINSNSATMSFDEFYEYLRGLCFDFFEAGIMLGEGSVFNVSEPKIEDVELDTAFRQQIMLLEKMNVGETPAEKSFDWWWNLYDKKCGKEKCFKKWKKLSLSERYACYAATPAYVTSTPDKQFRKNPLTYLNQKAWEDEIIIRQTPEQQQQQRLAKVAERIAGYTKDAK